MCRIPLSAASRTGGSEAANTEKAECWCAYWCQCMQASGQVPARTAADAQVSINSHSGPC